VYVACDTLQQRKIERRGARSWSIVLYEPEDGPFRTPIVFDNLIHQRAMPVTIGLFINPGHSGKAPPETPWQSDQRSYEYDSLSEKYSRFIIEEMIPEVEKTHRLSSDPKQRAIAGMSSGAICAFTVAWHRPDCFHKVMSHVGSFCDIRGGHQYPFWIRQWPKRELKVFLQSGENDLETQFGSWWICNLQMAKALEWRKYEHQFVGGKGGQESTYNAVRGASVVVLCSGRACRPDARNRAVARGGIDAVGQSHLR